MTVRRAWWAVLTPLVGLLVVLPVAAVVADGFGLGVTPSTGEGGLALPPRLGHLVLTTALRLACVEMPSNP